MKKSKRDKKNQSRSKTTVRPKGKILPGPMPPSQQTKATAKKRNNTITRKSKKTFLKSYVIAVTKRVILLAIVSKMEKTS